VELTGDTWTKEVCLLLLLEMIWKATTWENKMRWKVYVFGLVQYAGEGFDVSSVELVYALLCQGFI
jgi:hypothetical protein